MKKLKGILSVALIFAVYFSSIASTLAQTNRMRLKVPTGWGAEEREGVSSFRNTKPQFEMEGDRVSGSSGFTRMGGELMGSQYNVHVLGEVERPGTYRVAASTRLLQAVKRAGGFAAAGSKRRVELRRKGSAKRVDILKFEMLGSLKNNPYLMDNDVVFVPLRKGVVQVAGSVLRPMEYELNGERTLADVIKLSGGYSAGMAQKKPIKVIRFVNGQKKEFDVMNNPADVKNFKIVAGDVVYVSSVITARNEFDYNLESLPGEEPFYPSYEDRVFVLGGVTFPGAYPFSPYYTINQYISLSGGISDRGAPKFKVATIDGVMKKVKGGYRVNPGDTIYVKKYWMSPAAWVGFVMGIASFGLSVTATTLALTR